MRHKTVSLLFPAIFLIYTANFSFPSTLVADETVPTEEKILIREVVHEIQLKYEEEYNSPFIDVRDYQHVSFYVIPILEVLNRPQEDIAKYQLDAFFAVDTSMTTVLAFGETHEDVVRSGFQEFGTMRTNEEGILIPSFEKLTTGETASRVLHSRVYGPFVRVILKNLNDDDERRKFKIVAFLTKT